MSFLESFMPHGMCYAWRPDILWLNVTADAAIAIAYFSIPLALFHFLRKRMDAPFRGVVVMFCIFILACGITHVMSIVIVWNGFYGVQGVLKAITALASIGTAIMLYPYMPKMLALRTPAELAESHEALQQEMEHRKRTEIQSSELQNDIAHMGRITTMGQMATGLAHELNQPLLAISQSADTASIVAKESGHSDPELNECLEDIQAQTQRAGEIIRALRQFMSNDRSNRTDLDLNLLIKQTMQLVMPDARKHRINLKSQLSSIPEPNVDRVQIAQVLVNLLRNGVDAIAGANSKERELTVETQVGDDEIVVVVDDSGPGISDDVEPFRAFESSKPDGMGMGLSISRSIIEAHGGKLWLEENTGMGARFSFTLPLAGT